MLASDGAHEIEAESGALGAEDGAGGHAIEAAEDAFEVGCGDADALVGDTDANPGVLLDAEGHNDVRAVRGIFDGVAEDVEDGGLELVGIAAHEHGQRGLFDAEGDGGVVEVMAEEGGADAFLNERAHVDLDANVGAGALADFAGLKDLLDGGEQAIAVGQHTGVELGSLGFVEVTALEGFEVEVNRGDGGFELVGDGAEEGVVAFVAADFPDEEDRVDGDAGDEEGEEGDADGHRQDAAPVEDDPADVEDDGHADKAHAEQGEKNHVAAATGEAHEKRPAVAGGGRFYFRRLGLCAGVNLPSHLKSAPGAPMETLREFMAASTVKVSITNAETVVPDGVFIYSQTDLKGRITEANEAFAEISGYRPEEMVGQPHNLVRHPDMPREAFADLWKSLQEGRPWQAVVKNRRKDGGFYWVLANASPVRENGRVVGYQSIRFKPTREQIAAASEAYRRIREGDRSLRIVEGRVVTNRAGWLERLAGCTTQLRMGIATALLSSGIGTAAIFGESAHPVLRPIAEAVFALTAVVAVWCLLDADRRLHHDLQAVVGYLDRILTTGDMRNRLDLPREDCLGTIARKLSLLTNWVQATVLSVSDAVVHVEHGTQEVFREVMEIDKSANSQSAASASVAAAAAELGLTIREVSEHLHNTENTVSQTGEKATEGAGVTDRASEQIHSLAAAIKGASAEVEALGTTSAEVGQIAGVIREIADQTNLLALNASIEAARAGAAGRGFAVVATEVRNLADRTMKATANIDALIVKIKGDSERAINGMRTGEAQVAESVTMVQEARQALNGINGLMSDAVRRVTEIATSSSQQTEAMNEISRNITEVASMTEQNTAVVRRTTELMEVLNPMVGRVQKAVLQYRV